MAEPTAPVDLESAALAQRSPYTRFLDRGALWIRKHMPFLHWVGVALFAVPLYVYTLLLGLTVRLVTAGARRWPDVPAPCVLALWHGAAPSLLGAVARKKFRPKAPLVIMVATDPRGDALALVCRLMGLRVVRGDSARGGSQALLKMAEELKAPACAILTPDGGGPARFAKPGALLLAGMSEVPMVAVGADCRPALAEPHKWDAPRNPLPFGRIAIALSEPLAVPPVHDHKSQQAYRALLQQRMDQAAAAAQQALRTRG